MSTRITVTVGDDNLLQRNAQQQAASRQSNVISTEQEKAAQEGKNLRTKDRKAANLDPATGRPLPSAGSTSTIRRIDQEPGALRYPLGLPSVGGIRLRRREIPLYRDEAERERIGTDIEIAVSSIQGEEWIVFRHGLNRFIETFGNEELIEKYAGNHVFDSWVSPVTGPDMVTPIFDDASTGEPVGPNEALDSGVDTNGFFEYWMNNTRMSRIDSEPPPTQPTRIATVGTYLPAASADIGDYVVIPLGESSALFVYWWDNIYHEELRYDVTMVQVLPGEPELWKGEPVSLFSSKDNRIEGIDDLPVDEDPAENNFAVTVTPESTVDTRSFSEDGIKCVLVDGPTISEIPAAEGLYDKLRKLRKPYGGLQEVKRLISGQPIQGRRIGPAASILGKVMFAHGMLWDFPLLDPFVVPRPGARAFLEFAIMRDSVIPGGIFGATYIGDKDIFGENDGAFYHLADYRAYAADILGSSGLHQVNEYSGFEDAYEFNYNSKQEDHAAFLAPQLSSNLDSTRRFPFKIPSDAEPGSGIQNGKIAAFSLINTNFILSNLPVTAPTDAEDAADKYYKYYNVSKTTIAAAIEKDENGEPVSETFDLSLFNTNEAKVFFDFTKKAGDKDVVVGKTSINIKFSEPPDFNEFDAYDLLLFTDSGNPGECRTLAGKLGIELPKNQDSP